MRLSITPAAIALGCIWLYVDPLALFVPFLLCASIHETAHLILLRSRQIPIHALHITALGCVLQTGLLAYRDEWICAAAGPAANLLLFAILLPWEPRTALVSLTLALYNLLPIWPLDGGRILFACAAQHLPLPQALQWSRRIAWLVCLFLWLPAFYATCRLHLGLWPVLLAGNLQIRAGRARCGEKFVAKKRRCRYNREYYRTATSGQKQR